MDSRDVYSEEHDDASGSVGGGEAHQEVVDDLDEGAVGVTTAGTPPSHSTHYFAPLTPDSPDPDGQPCPPIATGPVLI
jgi:hypothetical protein